MSRSRYRIFEEEYPYFMTATIVAWLPVFAHRPFAEIILDAWRFAQRERGVKIFGYVVMETLHWIAQADDLSAKVGRFKSYTARQILDGLEQRGFGTMLRELRFFKERHKTDQMFQLWRSQAEPGNED